jgi:hypothetical protein
MLNLFWGVVICACRLGCEADFDPEDIAPKHRQHSSFLLCMKVQKTGSKETLTRQQNLNIVKPSCVAGPVQALPSAVISQVKLRSLVNGYKRDAGT